ncbi:MAG: leucine-rich repeat domain-containing protein [Candidatus Thorarchaeota archaeon]
MREFKVNEYITLKLETDKTFIYINGIKFLQCIQVMLEIPIENVYSYDSINSIDEAVEVTKHLHQNKIVEGPYARFAKEQQHSITPETEFWAHCSNLQVWYENNYDTRLLHHNLAFPLLKKLTEAGDPLAKRVFKEEIAKRFKSGFPSVVKYLVNRKYLKFFDEEEIETILGKNEYVEHYGEKIYLINDFLDLSSRGIMNLEEVKGLGALSSLRSLDLSHNPFDILKESINDLKSLKTLKLIECVFHSLPDGITEIKSLQKLIVDENQIDSIPEQIDNLKSLQILSIAINNLESLPESIGNLISLRELDLAANSLKKLPESIGNLISLQKLNLSSNKLRRLPKSIGNLRALERLVLRWNELSSLPESMKKLNALQSVNLKGNKFIEVDLSLFKNCKNLQELEIDQNIKLIWSEPKIPAEDSIPKVLMEYLSKIEV